MASLALASAASTSQWLWSLIGGGVVSALSWLLDLPVGTQITLALVLGSAVALAILTFLERPEQGRPIKLRSLREPGDRLLREARQPQTVATAAQIDDFMGRVGEWVESVTAVLIADDDRDRLDQWTRVGWHRGRPQPRDLVDAHQLLERPISERLTMLEGFCRELDAP